MAFSHRLTVRFEDVDFARAVYFPTVFGYCHNAFEEFFAREVGVSYARMLGERKVGFPAVHAEADFKQPLRFGDAIRVELHVLKVGQTSLHCRYRLHRDEALLAEVKIVTAAIDLDAFRSTAVPEDVRTAFSRHLPP